MAEQHGRIQTQWQCGHVESESHGWKDCPTCMQKRIAELQETIKLQQGAIAAKDKSSRQQQATIGRVETLVAGWRNNVPVDLLEEALGDKV